MRRLIIAFGHQRRRGKDTSASMAREYLQRTGRPCVKDAFAKSLKDGIGKCVLGLTAAQLHSSQKEVVDPFWGHTPRQMLQHIGTEVMRRHFRDDVWAKTLERRVLQTPEAHFVVADLRFLNEVEAIKRLGGVVVKCVRDVKKHPSDFHISEQALLDFTQWDFVLDNNGTLDHLKRQIEQMCRQLLR